ncbi:peptidoglycan-binding protein LysM [Flavobacterium sp. PS2]|uniref:peptidoglycan-binding protein LysM n=1 Tax=Flavobacterium sp. PS2 TaxID=3384157 RepID=UPI00390C939A
MYYIEGSEMSSYDKHRIYKIRVGDTLESVAHKLGIDARELRRYHNIYCPIPDLIEADFKSHLELLILAPVNSVNAEKKSIEDGTAKVVLKNDYTLPFLLRGLDKKYKVHYTSEVGDQVDTITTEVNVKWLAVDKNKFQLFEINKASNIYINAEKPDTMMDELGAKTAEILYPLKIVVDGTGKWVDIYNYNEIVTRWEDTKREILDYYEGEVTNAYIEHTEYALESSETLLASLSSDYFLRAFFNGIHVGYTANYSFENKISFPLEKNEESLFTVEQKVAPYLEVSGLIKVEQKGTYIDSSFDESFGFEPWEGNYRATYFLDSDTYCIENMNLECSIDYHEPIKIAITIDSLPDKIETES